MNKDELKLQYEIPYMEVSVINTTLDLLSMSIPAGGSEEDEI